DCRPIRDFVDPQGRELWIRSTIDAPNFALGDTRPRALYLAGVASSQAWLNGRPLGVNGQPGATAQQEVPGRYQAIFPIRDTAWRTGENSLVLHLSSFHGGLRFARPMSAMVVLPYPFPQRIALLAVTFVAAGALLAAAFGFGVIHAMRRTGSSLVLAAMAGVAALQAIVESLRTLFNYPYPLHAWRMSAIWGLAAAFAVLLVAYVATRYLPKARGLMIGLALGVVGATVLLPGFDYKTVWALILGVALAVAPAAAGVRLRVPGARLTLAYLALFLALAFGFPEWLADFSYFLLAA
ncbi:MAG: DNA-binding response regulator, partial [bacterium]|nr:DNA-binding response regulator [bacterium]